MQAPAESMPNSTAKMAREQDHEGCISGSKLKADKDQASADDAIKSTKSMFKNYLSGLCMEEPRMDDGRPDKMREPAFTKTDTNERQILVGIDGKTSADENHEIFFAVHCVLLDNSKMRTYLESIWKDYAKSQIGLVETPMINIAFERARRAQEQLYEIFPKLDGRPDLNTTFYLNLCLHRGQDPDHNEVLEGLCDYDHEEAAQSLSVLKLQMVDRVPPVFWFCGFRLR